MIDYPEVPDEILIIAADWHGGQFTELYAIASTGGITHNEDNATVKRWTDLERLEDLAYRWGTLSGELDDPVEAGDLDPAAVAEVDNMVDQLENLVESLDT